MIHLVAASAAGTRLAEARRFLASYPRDSERLVVAASREAADDLARWVTRTTGAAFGMHRFGVWQFVGRLAAAALSRDGLAPATPLGADALAARAVHELASTGRARAFAPVLGTPGFARAAASTVAELRLADITPGQLTGLGEAADDLGALVERFADELGEARLADRAAFLAAATAALDRGAPLGRLPTVALDVRITTRAAARLWTVLARDAPALLVTVPSGDTRTLDFWRDAGATPVVGVPEPSTSLGRVRRYVFADEAPPEGALDDSVELFSAPGEARESVEIVRRILDEARRGTPFDEMAVLLRAPLAYWSVLQHALRRGDVPARFSQGTRRPDPSGRAFLAVLACRSEGLSAARFAEYLSLGQIPRLASDGSARAQAAQWQSAADELIARADPLPASGQLSLDWEAAVDAAPTAPDLNALPAGLGGTLRAPRKWEALLVESAVIGGADRWARRLDGLAAELALRMEAAQQDEAGSAGVVRLGRDLEHLTHLRRFALPLVERLAALPDQARWGEWLDELEPLAMLVLKRPDRVLEVLAELRPMAAVGPVTLDELRGALTPRLTTVAEEPPDTRYGRVFIGTPEQALGRVFRVVFVPGLGERGFPQPIREDPLLLDALRRAVDPRALVTQADRASDERFWLRVAIGAAQERLYLSYPRMQLEQARPRVPSFYALDVMRAVRGTVPAHEVFSKDAAERGEAWLAWPAPRDPEVAIDDFEHDLATLGPLLHGDGPEGTTSHAAAARGRARYLVELNPHLGRALRTRFARWSSGWSRHDGLALVSDETRELLGSHRPTARPYSVSALQRFAACPYRFLLGSIYRLQPFEPPVAIERLDPLTRGAMFHEVQRELLRALAEGGHLPVTETSVVPARSVLDEVFARVAGDYRERLAPAIERVWQDEIEALRTDLRIWLEELVHDGKEWTPVYFELAFGLPLDAAHDQESVPDPVRLDGDFRLRGSIDLIEEHRETGHLRVTDHKTGRNRTSRDSIVGGGETLQPVLYSLAAERALGRPVITSRLSFCTTAGGFTVHEIPLVGTRSREAGLGVIEAIDRAVAGGVLPAAPRRGACDWCDFVAVCGPVEEERTGRKRGALVDDLVQLRRMP